MASTEFAAGKGGSPARSRTSGRRGSMMTALQARQIEVESQKQQLRRQLKELGVDKTYDALAHRRQWGSGAGEDYHDWRSQKVQHDVKAVRQRVRTGLLLKPHGTFMLWMDILTTFALLISTSAGLSTPAMCPCIAWLSRLANSQASIESRVAVCLSTQPPR